MACVKLDFGRLHELEGTRQLDPCDDSVTRVQFGNPLLYAGIEHAVHMRDGMLKEMEARFANFLLVGPNGMAAAIAVAQVSFCIFFELYGRGMEAFRGWRPGVGLFRIKWLHGQPCRMGVRARLLRMLLARAVALAILFLQEKNAGRMWTPHQWLLFCLSRESLWLFESIEDVLDGFEPDFVPGRVRGCGSKDQLYCTESTILEDERWRDYEAEHRRDALCSLRAVAGALADINDWLGSVMWCGSLARSVPTLHVPRGVFKFENVPHCVVFGDEATQPCPRK
jgi:hypothetical protein